MRYRMVPALRRGVFEPLLQLKRRSPLGRYWRELEQTQYLPESVLLQRQWQRLQSLIAFLWEKNDFYRQRLVGAGLTPKSIRAPEDMLALPLLTKEEVRRDAGEMLSRGFQLSQLMHFKTGGSTGKALDIYLTEECSELRNACARRHDRWAGWEIGEPVAAVWGNPHLPATLKERLHDCLIAPRLYLDTMKVNEESVRAFADRWERVKPTLLFGHAHSLFLLAQLVDSLKLSVIRPRGILSTSMMLFPHERALIEKVFLVKVTDRYGCEEVSLIASECEMHQGMHLNIEHLLVEFIRDDGFPAAAGEPGRIVVTDLMNRAFPLVRYQVEDLGVPAERRCPCGRGLPLMDQVTGRVADFLVTRAGSRVAGVSLIENTLTSCTGIDQMQIVQESMEKIALHVVRGRGFSDSTEDQLRRYFRELFGEQTEVEILLEDSIRPEPSGKYRFSICRVPAAFPDNRTR